MVFIIAMGEARAESGQIYRDTRNGFEITLPAGWQRPNMAEYRQALHRLAEVNPEPIWQAAAQSADLPDFMVTKHSMTEDFLTPSLELTSKFYGKFRKVGLAQVMALYVNSFGNRVPGFVVDHPPTEVEIWGREGAYCLFSHTVIGPDGKPGRVASEVWMVENGMHFLTITSGTRADEANGTRDEVAAIVNTIKLLNTSTSN